MTRIHVALGANLGDREAALRRALAGLAGTPGMRLVACSRFYETEPVGPPQPRYLNAAAALDTTLDAKALLARLHALEREAGRVRGARRDEPRTLDLDLLLYGELRTDDPELTLPHPRMHARAFVLVPLAEIAPEARHPGLGCTVRELLARLPAFAPPRPWP